MPDREKVIKDLEFCVNGHFKVELSLATKILALLKEQEEQVRKWTKEIADNQLAHAPKDWKEFMTPDEHMDYQYHKGIWNGLKMAWDILMEGR